MDELFPLTTLITPNVAEAELLLSQQEGRSLEIKTLDSLLSASESLLELCKTKAVLLKGGHVACEYAKLRELLLALPELILIQDFLPSENTEILQEHAPQASPEKLSGSTIVVVDVLYESKDRISVFVRPQIESESTHGTGCTLSAAIACGLAQGLDRASHLPPSTVTN